MAVGNKKVRTASARVQLARSDGVQATRLGRTEWDCVHPPSADLDISISRQAWIASSLRPLHMVACSC